MHSRIGIASFVCGISSIVVFIGSLGWIFFSSSADRVGLLFPTYKYLILLLIGLVVIGVVLGFISFSKRPGNVCLECSDWA